MGFTQIEKAFQMAEGPVMEWHVWNLPTQNDIEFFSFFFLAIPFAALRLCVRFLVPALFGLSINRSFTPYLPNLKRVVTWHG